MSSISTLYPVMGNPPSSLGTSQLMLISSVTEEEEASSTSPSFEAVAAAAAAAAPADRLEDSSMTGCPGGEGTPGIGLI